MTKKRINLAFALLLVTNVVFAKTILVTNPGTDKDIQPNIQTAVNSAVNGDLIQLPAGQFILNKSVVITKFISVKGQGLGQTILYRPESTTDASLMQSSMFRFNINSAASSGIVISDMTLKSKKPSLVDGDGLSRSVDMGIEFIKCLDFSVTRCRFEYFGNGAVSIVHEDNLARGVIYKNEFVHNAKGYNALGLGYGVVVYGVNAQWIADPKFGSSNFIFIEDNMFDYHRHSVAGGGCGLYVFRYNTVKNNVAGNSMHAIDAHEARLESGGNYYSTRAIEVYNNSIVNTLFRDGTKNCPDGTTITAGKSPSWLTESAITTRGGEAIIHNNYIEGYRFGVGVVANQVLNTAYPIPYQQGYLSAVKHGANHTGVDGDKGDGDVFVWNDNYKSYAPTNSQCVYFYNYSTTHIKGERDYHLYAKANYTPYTYPHPLRETTTPPTSIVLTTKTTNVSCGGGTDGTATVTATGGNPTGGVYTYSWSTVPVQTTETATKLVAGTYTVTVKDGTGGLKTATVTITQPTVIVVTTSSTAENCGKQNGTATVAATGGVTPYTYLWSNSQTTTKISNLAAGTYTITVTDAKNWCATTKTITVAKVNAPAAALTSKEVSCNQTANGSATVNVTDGEAPYTYEWNTVPAQLSATALNLSEGSYAVTVTDAKGCYTKQTTLIEKAKASFNLATTKTDASCLSCKDGSASVIVSGPSTTYTYLWSTAGNSSVAKSNFATGLSVGTYSISVADNNGCSKQVTTVINVAVPTDIASTISEKSDISLYPNPTQSKFSIKNGEFKPSESILVVLYNTAGVEVYSKVAVNESEGVVIDTENRLEPGIYIMMATTEARTYTKKVVITH